jgi:hypothetical protein
MELLHNQEQESESDHEAGPVAVADDLQQYTVGSNSTVDQQLDDDLSEALNGRESLDSGFGSADDMKFINGSKTDLPLDDIEEYDEDEDDSEEHEKNEGSDSNDDEPDRAYDRLSRVLPFKSFLRKNRRQSAKEDPIVVTEEADLTSSSRSSSPRINTTTSGLQFPWRRRSHHDMEEIAVAAAAPSPGAPLAAPGTPLESSTNHGGSKSVFSRARGLSIDLSILTGGGGGGGAEKKEKKLKSSPSEGVDPLMIDTTAPLTPSLPTHTEKQKKSGGAIRSIGDSLKKFTKGMGSRPSTTLSTPTTETTAAAAASNPFLNDEPISKFTADGIPLYWVGYQDAQFIALQPWQILLLPIVYQTEKYYDSALIPPPPPAPPSSPFQMINLNESLLSPSSVLSGLAD